MAKKLDHICYIITTSRWGGAQRYVADLAAAMVKDPAVDAVSVIAGVWGVPEKDRLLKKALSQKASFYPWLQMGQPLSFRDILAFVELWRLLRRLRPSVVHLNSSKTLFWGALAARFAGVPKIVATVHGAPFFEKRSFFWKGIYFLLTYLSLLLAHRVICISRYELRFFQRLWGLSGKCSLVYHAIPPLSFPSKEKARQLLVQDFHLPLQKNRCVLGGVASLVPNKGLVSFLPRLARVLKRFPEAVYVHLGDGPKRDLLLRQANALGIAKQVFFVGFVADAWRYMPAFDLLLLPSEKEGLPYVLLEAGACGVPVWAHPVGGVPELLGEKKGEVCGFAAYAVVLPNDFAAMVRQTKACYGIA